MSKTKKKNSMPSFHEIEIPKLQIDSYSIIVKIKENISNIFELDEFLLNYRGFIKIIVEIFFHFRKNNSNSYVRIS